MTGSLKTYLRTLRRSSGLTQKELEFLIGVNSSTIISRLECLQRSPSLAAAIACLLLFDTPPSGVFPALFMEVREAVLLRATELYEELQGNASQSNKSKL